MSYIPRIFIAYSRQDLAQLELLRTQLRVLERRELCHIFYDGVIQAGEKWAPRIKEELHRADIYLLLVTAEFLDSNFVNDIELPTILQREREGSAKVLPVILRQCLWKYSELEVFQAILYEDCPIEEKNNYGYVAQIVATEVKLFIAGGKPISSNTSVSIPNGLTPINPPIDLIRLIEKYRDNLNNLSRDDRIKGIKDIGIQIQNIAPSVIKQEDFINLESTLIKLKGIISEDQSYRQSQIEAIKILISTTSSLAQKKGNRTKEYFMEIQDLGDQILIVAELLRW